MSGARTLASCPFALLPVATCVAVAVLTSGVIVIDAGYDTGMPTCSEFPAPAPTCMPVNDTACVPTVFAPAVPQLAVPVGVQVTPGAAIVTTLGSVSAKVMPVPFDGPVLVIVTT